MNDTYFETQNAALQYADQMAKDKGYTPEYPEHLWAEHVNYDTTVKYHIPLITKKGNYARKFLHIVLYRLDSGRYELTTFLM